MLGSYDHVQAENPRGARGCRTVGRSVRCGVTGLASSGRVLSGSSSSCPSCAHASALQRVCSIARRTRLMRSHGCQRQASFTAFI